MKKLGSLKDIVLMTLGTAIIAASVFFFLVPSDIPLGSVTGLAIIISKMIPVSISVITFCLNVILLIIGFIFIGPEFGAKTVYTSLLMPVFMGVFERLWPSFASIMGDQLLDVCFFLFMCSIGQAILFKLGASSGGLDIVGKLINKYMHIELGKAVSAAGLCAALCAAAVYDLRTVLLGVLGTYASGVVLDHFIFSFGGKKRVCIISQKEDEVKKFILDEINRGATIYNAVGAYDGKPRREIITLIDQAEYRKLVDFISKTDPSAFVSVYSVSDVLDNSIRVPKK